MGSVADNMALGQVYSKFFGIPLTMSFHRGSPYSYHMGDKQQARWWQQFRDIVDMDNTSLEV
jgi:hypothetical protein